MKLTPAQILFPACLGLALNACATTAPPPAALVLARMSYAVASSGPVAVAAPNYLADARQSLDKANQEFATHGDTGICRDYSYITENKLELAESVARVEASRLDLRTTVSSDSLHADAPSGLLTVASH